MTQISRFIEQCVWTWEQAPDEMHYRGEAEDVTPFENEDDQQ